MKDRPILMSAPMVRASLREIDPKGQTRRIMKPQPHPNGFIASTGEILTDNDYLPPDAMLLTVGKGRNRYTTSNYEGWESSCPYGQPGDLLWVRETWCRAADAPGYLYAATESEHVVLDDGDGFAATDTKGRERSPWKPSIHMPRWASRLTLRITDVRVQRLQDISEEDAIAEGVERDSDGWFDYLMPGTQCCTNARDSFRTLWESINGAGSWDANPYVWALTFEVIKQNVDAVLKEAA